MNESASASDPDTTLSRKERIDRRCDDFERAWRSGQQPKTEDYVNDLCDVEYRDMLRELIAVELERRYEGGAHPRINDYIARFPGQTEPVQAAFDLVLRPANDRTSSVDTSITEKPGTVIGPYKLMEQIGEGGFGLVFAAEQRQPLRRKVALKIIKPGMDTKEIIARFEAERQALALISQHRPRA